MAITDLEGWAVHEPYHSTERQLNSAFLDNSSWGHRELEENTNQIFSTVEHAFDTKRHGQYLDEEFALLFIDAIKPEGRHQSLHDFLGWIADLASRDPLAALTVCERLASKLSDLESPHQIRRTEPLISALSAILREADETDDETLIRRAVHLQDQFLRIDIRGIEDFFEQAGRLY